MNCSQMVRARLGKTPTEPWGEPSGFRKPNPTIPGGPSGSASWLVELREDLAQETPCDLHIWIEDQQPGASCCSPAGVDAGGEPSVFRPGDQAKPGRGDAKRFGHRAARGVIDDDHLTVARARTRARPSTRR